MNMEVPAISALLERCFSHAQEQLMLLTYMSIALLERCFSIILKTERDCLLRTKFDELLFLKINTSELIFSDVINIFIQ